MSEDSPGRTDIVPLPVPDVLTVYGADWCGDCQRATRYLERTGRPFRWVDVAADHEAHALVDGAGYRSIPIIVTPAGTVLIEPSDDELERALTSAA